MPVLVGFSLFPQLSYLHLFRLWTHPDAYTLSPYIRHPGNKGQQWQSLEICAFSSSSKSGECTRQFEIQDLMLSSGYGEAFFRHLYIICKKSSAVLW